MRRLFLLILLLGIGGCVTAGNSPADAEMLAYLKSVSFPMYRGNEPAGPIRCVGWNGAVAEKNAYIFAFTAEHCREPQLHARDADGWKKSGPVVFSLRAGPYDQMIFLKPGCMNQSPVFSTRVTTNEKYYTLGHKSPNDPFESLGLVKLRFLRYDPERGLVFSQMCSGEECEFNLLPGVSGSPVINSRTEIVGSYHGFSAFRPNEPFVSPLDLAVSFLRTVALTSDQTTSINCP